jgi:hypothetical protein
MKIHSAVTEMFHKNGLTGRIGDANMRICVAFHCKTHHKEMHIYVPQRSGFRVSCGDQKLCKYKRTGDKSPCVCNESAYQHTSYWVVYSWPILYCTE